MFLKLHYLYCKTTPGAAITEAGKVKYTSETNRSILTVLDFVKFVYSIEITGEDAQSKEVTIML